MIGVCLAVLVVVLAWKAAGWWQRRQALQAFAATRGWRWRGFLDSGAHYPYSGLERLRSAALLQNVIEGDLGGYGLCLFDYSSRRRAPCTSVLVRLPEEPPRLRVWTADGVVKPSDYASFASLGSRLEAALARHQHLSVETESSSLLVEATGCLKVQEVPALLDSAVSLANALVEDTRAAELKPL